MVRGLLLAFVSFAAPEVGDDSAILTGDSLGVRISNALVDPITRALLSESDGMMKS